MKLIKYILSVATVTLLYTGIHCISASAEETTLQTTAVTQSAESATSTTAVTFTDVTETTATVVSLPVQDGWNNIDRKWFYYNNGTTLTGVAEIDSEYYLFATNGAMKTGWQTVNGIRTYFDIETHSPVYGWITHIGNKYYNDNELGKLTGLHDIDGSTYFFDESGIMKTGFVSYNNFVYYCNDNGAIVKGDNKKTPVAIDETSYIISPTGRILTGWQTVNSIRTYYDYNTAQPVYGWIKYQGKYYYTDAENGKYTGDMLINDHPYRFDSSGVIQTGLQKFSNSGQTCFYYEDGTWATGFKKVGNDTYFFDKNGFMTTGWQTISKNKYYFGSDGKMRTNWQTIGKSKYYFGSDGKMRTNWQTIGKSKYYFGSDGKMRTNWQTIDKSKYYFGSDGKMKTNWQTIDKSKYYFGSDGKMRTKWQTISKSKYYFGSDGKMQTGFHIIDGKYCNFNSNGVFKPIKVFVGVGHGGYDPGAIGYIVEKEYTLKTAKIVEKYLKAAGIDYMLSRTADIDTTMASKLKLCNDYDPDLIIDIHFNAAGGHGFEVYHSMYGGMSKTLAENITEAVSKLPISNSGCQTFINAEGKDRFTIIRETHAPSVLIEGGYVDDWSDAQFIKSYFAELAKAYAEGVLKTIVQIFKGK